MVVNAAQLASYSQAKQFILGTGKYICIHKTASSSTDSVLEVLHKLFKVQLTQLGRGIGITNCGSLGLSSVRNNIFAGLG